MSARRTAIGNDGLSIGRGDVIQTRRNDSGVRVANRQVWVAQSVEEENSVWVTERAAGHRPRSARLPANYVAEHTHLAYVATAHGVQSMTVDESHTVVGGATGAASVYVGMTRGRDFNRVHLVAANADEAREQFVLATERDRADRGPMHATAAAQESVQRLTTGASMRRHTIYPTDWTGFIQNAASTSAPAAGLRR